MRSPITKIAIATGSLWLVPALGAAWLGDDVSALRLLALGACGVVQGLVLLAMFVLGLRLERGAIARGTAWGAATATIPAIALGSPMAIVSGLATGLVLTAYLCTEADVQWYPTAPTDKRPSHLWYWGRAVYVSRRDYARITIAFLCVGVPLAIAGVLGPRVLLGIAVVIAAIGVLLLAYSLVGLYRMYARPSLRYYRALLSRGGVRDDAVIADLHIGTYRTAFALADLLPNASIHSIDCWDRSGPSPEEAVGDVRAIEPAPSGVARITTSTASRGTLPLASASCDAIVLGFGTHEIPAGGPRERLFAEAQRILKPGGVALLFEHGYDVHNYVIFGPVIDHVTRRAEWLRTMRAYFRDVTYARSSAAVDMLVGWRHA